MRKHKAVTIAVHKFLRTIEQQKSLVAVAAMREMIATGNTFSIESEIAEFRALDALSSDVVDSLNRHCS